MRIYRNTNVCLFPFTLLIFFPIKFTKANCAIPPKKRTFSNHTLFYIEIDAALAIAFYFFNNLIFSFTHWEVPPANEDQRPPVRTSLGALNFGFLGRPPQQLKTMVNTTSPCAAATIQAAIHVKFCREWSEGWI